MQFWCGTGFMRAVEMPAVARMLDEAGYFGMMTPDHLIYPRESVSPYSTPDGRPFWAPETEWPDSWVLIGAMSAVTTTLRFSNSVYIAASRPLLEVAKQVATAAALSSGRVSLGIGAGWMREEFELQGQDFGNRGRRLSEMVPALRALWQGGWVQWDGEHYQVPELMMEPHPPQPVPILCGGESEAALRRATELCDGWIGTAYTWDDAVAMVARVKGHLAEYGRAEQPFDIIVAFLETPSPDLFHRAEDLGVTGVMCSPWAEQQTILNGDHQGLHRSAERYRASIETFAEEILAKCP
jgi:probable F420-dependent oxidoreductase